MRGGQEGGKCTAQDTVNQRPPRPASGRDPFLCRCIAEGRNSHVRRELVEAVAAVDLDDVGRVEQHLLVRVHRQQLVTDARLQEHKQTINCYRLRSSSPRHAAVRATPYFTIAYNPVRVKLRAIRNTRATALAVVQDQFVSPPANFYGGQRSRRHSPRK